MNLYTVFQSLEYQKGKTVGGIFYLRDKNTDNAWTFEQAQAACTKNGATLASFSQLQNAWKNNKYDKCSCGWISDKKARFPITTQIQPGNKCGGPKPGIRDCVGWGNGKWNAFCSGMYIKL